MKGRTWLAIISAVVLGLWISGGLIGQHTALQRASAALAVERTDRLAAEARAAGFEVVFAALSDEVVKKDSIARAFEKRARLAEARTVTRTVTRVEARVDTLIVGVPVQRGVRANVSHDPLFGTIEFRPPLDFALELVCSPRIEQYLVEAADGRWLVAARALSPRTVLKVEALEIPQQNATQPASVRWYHLPIAALVGAVTWEIAR